MKRKLFRRRWFVLTLLAIAVAGGTFAYGYNGRKSANGEKIKVERGVISQEVIVTGNVKPREDVLLAFERSGKIAKAYVKVGDKVRPGQVLVELGQNELAAQLLDAEANHDAQIAKLEELRRGTRQEDVQIKQTELLKARQDLANDYTDIPDVVQDAHLKANDAVRKQTDELFGDDESITPQLSFSIANSQLETNVESLRASLTGELNAWSNELARIAPSTSPTSLDTALKNAKRRLENVRQFLNLLNDALVASTGLSQSTINTYKSNVSAALANVNAAITNINAQQQTITSEKLAVKKIEDELALKLAGSAPEAIRAQEAAVKQAEAKVKVAEAELGETILRAPIAGTVTTQDAKVGEIVAANAPLVAIISDQELEIEANVPEVDIGRVAAGNGVTIRVDAFPGEAFRGTVIYVDPAETIVEGVVNFKITVAFEKADPRMKSGLTANLAIKTLEKKDALILPQFAILENDEGTFARKIEQERVSEIPVILGIRSQDGFVEIVSGLSEGDMVLNIGRKERTGK